MAIEQDLRKMVSRERDRDQALVEDIRTARLEASKYLIEAANNWSIALMTVCFTLGAAFVPLSLLIPHIKHPLLFTAGGALLLADGFIIAVSQKQSIERELIQSGLIASKEEHALTQKISKANAFIRAGDQSTLMTYADESLKMVELAKLITRTDSRPARKRKGFLGLLDKAINKITFRRRVNYARDLIILLLIVSFYLIAGGTSSPTNPYLLVGFIVLLIYLGISLRSDIKLIFDTEKKVKAWKSQYNKTAKEQLAATEKMITDAKSRFEMNEPANDEGQRPDDREAA